jgi:hypothetical protein
VRSSRAGAWTRIDKPHLRCAYRLMQESSRLARVNAEKCTVLTAGRATSKCMRPNKKRGQCVSEASARETRRGRWKWTAGAVRKWLLVMAYLTTRGWLISATLTCFAGSKNGLRGHGICSYANSFRSVRIPNRSPAPNSTISMEIKWGTMVYF